jgi:hypothetical protein
MSLRDKILDALAKPAFAPLEIPEWGTTVYLSVLTVGERERLFGGEKTEKTEIIELLRSAVRDEKGSPIFGSGDTATIKEIPVTISERIISEWAKHNRLDAKAVEEAEKN